MNMSFSLTTDACISFQKTVTRRIGWNRLQEGQVLQQVEKAQGLKKGEKVVKIYRIQVFSIRPETLSVLLKLPEYGHREMEREGFRGKDPKEFIAMFQKANRCTSDEPVKRIEFRYLLSRGKASYILVPAHIKVCSVCGGHIRLNGVHSYNAGIRSELRNLGYDAQCVNDMTHTLIVKAGNVSADDIDVWLDQTFRFYPDLQLDKMFYSGPVKRDNWREFTGLDRVISTGKDQ